MTINLTQHYEYTCKFVSCSSFGNSFILSTDNGLLIAVRTYCTRLFQQPIISIILYYYLSFSFQDLHSDLFRPTADYKVFRTSLAYSKEKPFEDKNFKTIRFQRPITCPEHNLIVYPSKHG